ncbi:hypothetical protein BU15DRAFT_64958 [Melanogaster broomeanus]|nr:hypothetical protein BU15DRAFT_64958 [Melanogaster broomeanus]
MNESPNEATAGLPDVHVLSREKNCYSSDPRRYTRQTGGGTDASSVVITGDLQLHICGNDARDFDQIPFVSLSMFERLDDDALKGSYRDRETRVRDTNAYERFSINQVGDGRLGDPQSEARHWHLQHGYLSLRMPKFARGNINWHRGEIDITQHKIEAARRVNTNRRRRLHDKFSEGCLDVIAIPMSEVFAQWTARITFLPAAAACCTRRLKTEPTEAWAGSDERERERCELPDRGQTFLPLLSVMGMSSASGAHAISNALMVKSSFSIRVRDGAVGLEVTPKEDSVEYDVIIDKAVC